MPVPLTYVLFVGIVKVSWGVAEALAPLFVMTLVKVSAPPGATLAGAADSVTANEALKTVDVLVPVLLVVTGSKVAELTVADPLIAV